jgi:tetratricopeptide (TPR) repeat protein
MAKKVCTLILIVLLNVLVGCQNPNSGYSRRLPPRTRPSIGTGQTINLTDAGEIDLVEKVAASRQAYKQGLELLVKYYTKTGDNQKLGWANKELNALNVIPQYDYIVPVVQPKDYRATTSIPDADLLYEDALIQKNQAEKFGLLLVDKDLYRMALKKFEDVIKRYPTSDKIDDAAYYAGEISEYFKDYSIALEYYQAAYTWDPETDHPARFRAARILDQQMHNNAAALELYKKAVETEGKLGKYREWKESAEQRIRALEKSRTEQP